MGGRIDELEKRVALLERRARPVFEPAETPTASSLERAVDALPTISASSSLTVLGKSLLGIAGAYLLRAVSSYGAVLRDPIAVVAAVYAIAWLAAGARAVTRNRLAGILYTSTSLLILSPMLWEMTLRFHAMSAGAALAALAAFVVATGVTARAPQRSAVVTVAYAGSAITALSLAITTRVMLPFIALLLAMVLWDEVSKLRGRPCAVAPMVLLASDAAVWALLFIYRAPASARPEYPDLAVTALLAAPFVLFTLHAAGIAIRARSREFRISSFEIFQALAGLALTACGLLWLTPDSALVWLGILCAVLASACYLAALGRFRESADQRNFRVFAVWSAALLLATVYLLLPSSLAGMALGFASIAAAFAGRRMHCLTLVYHGVLYLAAGSFSAGLPRYVYQAFAGEMPHAPSLGVIVLSAVAICVYAVCDVRPGEAAGSQFAAIVTAMLAAFSACALAINGIVSTTGLFLTPSVPLTAFLRTLTLCAFAFAIAVGGAWLRRRALTRVAYTLIAFVVAKLFFEDMRHEKLEFIAGSICLVALTFLIVPRIGGQATRRSRAR